MPTRSIHVLSICLTLSVVLTAGPATAQDLAMGNVNPPRHGTSLASQQFIDKLAELSGGKIKVAHHHSGALGGEREVAQQIQLGAIDFTPITTAPLSTLVPEMSVFQLPYIFRDYDHVFKALDGSDRYRQILRSRARQEGPQARRLHRRRLSRHLWSQRHQQHRRRQGQEGAGAGGPHPGRHLQGARHDLDARSPFPRLRPPCRRG